jgi:two-component system phosphate regulon sensor histidine kinase PhoR
MANAVTVGEQQRLIVIRDITRVHNLEQARRDFVANISHELRTPLTVLRGYLELLENHPADDVGDSVKRMLGQALQMQTLLDDLLELSRLQDDVLRDEETVVNVPTLLMQLKEQAEELSRDNHQLIFKVDSNILLTGSSADLESAFSNLITNAIKYTPRGGTIQVRWERGPNGPRMVVHDTGIGIPRRDIPRLTERFYRVGSDRARETGGTGLGLAIVKHVLKAHQAELSINSVLGEGSQFTCTFPEKRARSPESGL